MKKGGVGEESDFRRGPIGARDEAFGARFRARERLRFAPIRQLVRAMQMPMKLKCLFVVGLVDHQVSAISSTNWGPVVARPSASSPDETTGRPGASAPVEPGFMGALARQLPALVRGKCILPSSCLSFVTGEGRACADGRYASGSRLLRDASLLPWFSSGHLFSPSVFSFFFFLDCSLYLCTCIGRFILLLVSTQSNCVAGPFFSLFFSPPPLFSFFFFCGGSSFGVPLVCSPGVSRPGVLL